MLIVGPAQTVERQAELEEAQAVMAELPEEWQAILTARAVGYTPAEIQAALGLSERQYRKRIQKANRRLSDR